MGFVKILKLIALNHFLGKEEAAMIKSSYRNYHLYLVSPTEIHFNHKFNTHQQSKIRVVRGLIQLAILLAYNQTIVYLADKHYHVSSLPFLWRGVVAGIQLSLCFQSLSDLLLACFGYVFPDIFLEDIFKYPILACSPREFWGKRWNLVIHRQITRMIYIPLGGRNNKPLALLVVYIVVGLMHEVPMMFLPSAKLGYWILIFVVHIAAMLAQFLVERAKFWDIVGKSMPTKIIVRLCTLSLLACSAEFAYTGFGMSVEQMARDFNSIISTVYKIFVNK
jgi:D-alanyl-lipoteichoic acid acyltransferase DltB (MBOAT superfamily)